MEINKLVVENIIAIIPIYLDLRGNCTLIHTLDKSHHIYRRLNTVLNQLAQYYLVDLRSAKSYCANILSIKNLTPLPFNRDNIFVPIKVRKPLFKNDGSFAYVNIKYIEAVKREGKGTSIYLNNQIRVDSLSSLTTVNRHIKNGHIVKKFWKERQLLEPEEKDFYQEYSQPATKGDIALLREEILRIREEIK